MPLSERRLHPALATVRPSIDQAGRAIVTALERIVAGEKVAPIQLPTELVVRQTSRAAAPRTAIGNDQLVGADCPSNTADFTQPLSQTKCAPPG